MAAILSFTGPISEVTSNERDGQNAGAGASWPRVFLHYLCVRAGILTDILSQRNEQRGDNNTDESGQRSVYGAGAANELLLCTAEAGGIARSSPVERIEFNYDDGYKRPFINDNGDQAMSVTLKPEEIAAIPTALAVIAAVKQFNLNIGADPLMWPAKVGGAQLILLGTLQNLMPSLLVSEAGAIQGQINNQLDSWTAALQKVQASGTLPPTATAS
jgi:hypothetical protein